MTFIERLELLDRFIGFIQREGTGTPVKMACRLGVSERTLHNLIRDLKNMGFDIAYCRNRPTYYFKEEVKINFFPIKIKTKQKSIKGGKNHLLYDILQNWCSRRV